MPVYRFRHWRASAGIAVSLGERDVANWHLTNIISRADDVRSRGADYARISGKGDKPIIDITGVIVRETFGKASHVIVSYCVDRITIKSED